MDRELLKKRLEGCYITVPTMFRDPDLEVDPAAIRRHVGFLLKRGINAGNGVLLAGGAAGDFSAMSFEERRRLCAIPNVVGLKWATPRTDAMEFEDTVSHFARRVTIIDNNLLFAMSHMMGARAFEVHLCNYWPEWGIKLLDRLNARDYPEVQRMMVEEAMPFYKLWVEIEKTYTSGDGYLDKLCMELVGLDSARCRPPTRDVREKFREGAHVMMIKSGVPGVRE